MQNSVKGFSMVELLVAAGMTAVGALAVVGLAGGVTNMMKNSNSQMGSQGLRNAVTSIVSDPTLCTNNLKGMKFDPTAASASSSTNGLPISITLSDGTVIDGTTPVTLNNFSVTVPANGFVFRTAPGGPAVPLAPYAGYSDPDFPNNSIYAGDIYLTMQKAVGATGNPPPNFIGGSGMNSELIGTVMLTVDKTTNIVDRCYFADPCLGMGFTTNTNSTTTCNICPAGQTWVGNTASGLPSCLPVCAPNQFLVSTGTGSATCVTPTPPVNGTCGPANSHTYTSAAAANAAGICSTGTAAPLIGAGPWTWICAGLHLGSSSPLCTANYSGSAINGACGTANGASFYSASAIGSNECSSGNGSVVMDNSPGSNTFTWSCAGIGGGSNVACAANKEYNAVCGGANGNTYANAAAVNAAGLCFAGTSPAPVGGVGPWSWTCNGINGGANISCSATLSSGLPVNGACGPANGAPPQLSSAAVLALGPLCTAGTAGPIMVIGNQWDWTCTGLNGGTSGTCSNQIKLKFPIQLGSGGASNTYQNQTGIDGAGNSFSTGITDTQFTGANPLMNLHIMGSHGLMDAFVAQFAPSGLLTTFSELGMAGEHTEGYGSVTDNAGNTYIVGFIMDPAGGYGDVLPSMTQYGTHSPHDGFVAKISPFGLDWVSQFGGNIADVAYDTELTGVSLDGVGNLVLTGYTMGVITGDTQVGTHGYRDAVVIKLNAGNGQLTTGSPASSIMQIGDGGLNSTKGSGIAVDATNIYVAGYTTGVLAGGTQLGTHGINDLFLIGVNKANLALNWATQLGVAGSYTGTNIDTSYCANLVLNTDFYVSSCTNGVVAGATQFGTHGITDLLLVKFDHITHAADWISQLGVAGQNTGGTIAMGSTSPLYVTGGTSGILPLSTLVGTHGSKDAVVATFTTAGIYTGATQLGQAGQSTGAGLSIVNAANTGVILGGLTSAYLGGTQYGFHGATDMFVDPVSVTPPPPPSPLTACTVQTLCEGFPGECAGWPTGGGFVLSTEVGSPYGNVCCVMSPGYSGNGDGKTLWCEDQGVWAAAAPPGGAPVPTGSGCSLASPGYPVGGGIIMYSNTLTSPAPNEICCSVGLAYSGPGPNDGIGWYCEANAETTAVVTTGPTQAGSPCSVTGVPYPANTGITLYTNTGQRVCCDIGAAYDGTGDGKGMECVNY